MQLADRYPPWRSDFLAALRLLAQAAARQPYGVADPVLCGPAAVALYTGDLWPAYAIDVRATGGQALNSELMALGFRCIEPASHGGNGLWHPDCGLGISVLEDCQDLPPAERANVLTVTLDRASDRYSAATAPKLRVIGVEDLIVAQTVSWLEHAPQCDDVMALLRTLVTLGRMGVCGRFRADYLRHRLACETGGEAVLDMARGAGDARDPRAMTLAAMRAVIEAWHTESGFGFARSGPPTPDAPSHSGSMILHRNDSAEREGQGALGSGNVVPFGSVPGSPSRPR